MANLVSTPAVGPPRHKPAEEVGKSRVALDVIDVRAVRADRSGGSSRVPELDGPYRKTHRDYSCIRVVAASAIVAGLLLGTAPVALAQVGLLIASVPAAFAPQAPAPATSGASDVQRDNTETSIAETSITVQHRLAVHPTPSLISWDGTSRALKCSYSLVFDGNTRSCQAA
jgi:hypothetical protein